MNKQTLAHTFELTTTTSTGKKGLVVELSPNGVELKTLKEDAIDEIKSQPYF